MLLNVNEVNKKRTRIAAASSVYVTRPNITQHIYAKICYIGMTSACYTADLGSNLGGGAGQRSTKQIEYYLDFVSFVSFSNFTDL